MKKFLTAATLIALVTTGISGTAHAQSSVAVPATPTVAATPSAGTPSAPVMAPAIGQPIESKAKVVEPGSKETIKSEQVKIKKEKEVSKDGVKDSIDGKKTEAVKTTTDAVMTK
jgi:hypothetical protein